MKMKFNVMAVAALAVVTMGGAQAALSFPTSANQGNGSILFAAHDANNQITLVVDLGLTMSDFVEGSAIHAAGTQVTWNFGANSVSGISTTGNDWSAAYNTFKATQSGNDFKWAVISADAISGTSITATNAVIGRGYMATGNPTAAELVNTNATTSAPIANAIGAGTAQAMYAAANNLGNIASAANGAGTTAGGSAFGVLGGNFNGFGAWNYFMTNGATSAFTYLRQGAVANPVAYQFGATVGIDTLAADPSTFRFDIDTNTLTWVAAPVPEPGTYALMLAGIAGLGFMARRRQR